MELKPFGNGIDVCPVCGKPSTIGNPMTNADHIRAMTDEEMAEQLYLLRLDALRLEGYDGFIETKDEILDWLKQKARFLTD